MASAAQIKANRSNAKKSTGPRTPEGKEKASKNAVRHGLLAQQAVIAGEDPEQFELHRQELLEEMAPVGPVETMLAERIVGLQWRLLRAERLQNAAFAALDDGEPMELLEARHEEWKRLKGSERDQSVVGVFDEQAALAKVVVEDFGYTRILERLMVYERRIESSLYRTMAQLGRQQQARTGAGAAAPAPLGSFGAEAAPEGASHPPGGPAAGQEPAGREKLASFGAEAKRTPYGVTPNGNRRRDPGAPEPRATAGGVTQAPSVPSCHHARSVPGPLAAGQSRETNPISRGGRVRSE